MEINNKFSIGEKVFFKPKALEGKLVWSKIKVMLVRIEEDTEKKKDKNVIDVITLISYRLHGNLEEAYMEEKLLTEEEARELATKYYSSLAKQAEKDGMPPGSHEMIP